MNVKAKNCITIEYCCVPVHKQKRLYERKKIMRLTNLTWPKAQEYFEKNDMVLISIGSIECHGRHMPLGTDTLIPEHLLEKIEKKSDVLIVRLFHMVPVSV